MVRSIVIHDVIKIFFFGHIAISIFVEKDIFYENKLKIKK